MNHAHIMQQCLDLAERHLASVAPNPMVGACVVIDGEICSFGAHEFFGGPHAEVNAITQRKDNKPLSNATLYVTLEPCNHFGKTPPCTELIIQSGIRSVVVACHDPNPIVAGKGIARLREHGISVTEGVLTKEAEHLNRRFFTFHKKQRPYVILKWAETADRFIARADGTSKWISGEQSRRLVHQWRSEEQAIMVGTRTALNDNPALTVRDVAGKNPTRIVIDRAGILPADLKLWNREAKTLCFANENRASHGAEEIVPFNRDSATISQLLDTLYQRNILSVFVEGGADTIGRFITAGMWDEARVFRSKTKFETGIEAPRLSSEHSAVIPFHTQEIGEDTLSLYRNDHALGLR